MKRKIETYGKAKNKKPIGKKYIIMTIVLVCLFGFMIINISNNGELNDYENYKPVVEVNETEDGERLFEELEGVTTVVMYSLLLIIGIGILILTRLINILVRNNDIF